VPVNLQAWEGLIFLNLSERPTPLAEQAEETTHPRIPRYNIPELHSAQTFVDEVKGNWKLVIANYQECAHCALVHPELSAKVPTFKAGLTTGGLDYGADFAGGVRTLTPSGTSNRPPLPGLLPEDHHRYYGAMLFPNVFLDMHPDYVVLATLRPQAPDHTRIVTEVLFHPDTMARPDFDPTDAIDFTNLVNQLAC
jgi:Rieske 2Fe-2S family protein